MVDTGLVPASNSIMNTFSTDRAIQPRRRASELLRQHDPHHVLKEGTVGHLVALAAIEEVLVESLLRTEPSDVEKEAGHLTVESPLEYACIEAFVRIQERHSLCAGMGEWRRMSYARAMAMVERGEAAGLRHELYLVTSEKEVFVNEAKLHSLRQLLHTMLARLPLASDEADSSDKALACSLRALLGDLS